MTAYKSDIEIAQEAVLKPVMQLGKEMGIDPDILEPYGHFKAKVPLEAVKPEEERGKIILVTSLNPTPAGEGKSTVTVGLGQALNAIGRKAVVALREPSLGPTMGLKGGACGGGKSQVVPMEDINLHFTGDLHAITSAHNTLAALVDNHIHRGNELDLDIRKGTWKRVLDINDRSLRNIVAGLGGRLHGVPHETGFDITVASEIMAVLCLADGVADLKDRLRRMIIGYNSSGKPVTCGDLKAEGALALLLREAVKPNLVQTLENTPAFVHGGPFANIAHGCNSLAATKMAASYGEFAVTESGFGADLGAEKFFHIKAEAGGFSPSAVVLVATVRALKMHGGRAKDDLKTEDLEALEKGLENLEKHLETIHAFGVPVVVAVNAFVHDTKAETDRVLSFCRDKGVPAETAEVWEHGGAGGTALAKAAAKAADAFDGYHTPLYDKKIPVKDKIRRIVQEVYGAEGVDFSKEARNMLETIRQEGLEELPVCMAKTQYSLSDDPSKLGRPRGFRITVRELRISRGAGFIVALTGSVMTMPGLPEKPAAMEMDVLDDGRAAGLF
ncbi:formate--tetrahydrofolate ligase [Alkalicoccus urumqiensis]|uniref:Formate--tetrahydrofolate ligase n=1 Tax=Alkalicoccus urumqiensis TaxID=1548213 RepID=A0A2P6MKI7_ALKUR|nr:formate--tetrahydrofolate ligase [Alkalicoccus urumqiensis]PRO66786.1 formate--tetrahydrofolate ligase [Alkalicoccus urumqiensis]